MADPPKYITPRPSQVNLQRWWELRDGAHRLERSPVPVATSLARCEHPWVS